MSISDRGNVPLRIAIGSYGHTADLKRGAVPITGVSPDWVEVTPIIAAFRRMVRALEFDACEMAIGTYMIAREAGLPVTALPVFTYRRFHHAGFVCREDAGIRVPKDLEGRKAGVRAWSVTTGIWTRGILQNEYGVDLSRITWVTDDEEHVTSLKLPANVSPAPPGRTLVDMMADGELQAAFADNAGIGRAGPPEAGWHVARQPVRYAELFGNATELEAAWYRRTGIYPAHGTIVVKNTLLAQYPRLAQSLFDAFVIAKDAYLARLQTEESASDRDTHYRTMAALVGDPLPYGLGCNRPTIQAFITYCRQQGLLKNPCAPEDLFIAVEDRR